MFVQCGNEQLTKRCVDIWYNKWAGGDREDSYSK